LFQKHRPDVAMQARVLMLALVLIEMVCGCVCVYWVNVKHCKQNLSCFLFLTICRSACF